MAPKQLDKETFLHAIVHRGSPVREAIGHMVNEAAIVVDDERKLCGLITDGDLRRAFLAGATLDTPLSEVMTKSPMTISTEMSHQEILAVMLRKKIRHLPVVDANGYPIGLELLKNQYEETQFTEAVLMAGGKGTRLHPLTYETPKPLLDIGNGTIIDNVLDGLRNCGIRDVIISVNYLGEKIREHINDGQDRQMNVAYVEEEKALGTAGALSLLDPRPAHNFIVMNADLITEMDFRALDRFHKEEKNHLSVCVRSIRQPIPFGVVSLHEDRSRIANIVEKPEYDLLVNAGIYMLEPEIIDLIPKNMFFDMVSLIRKAIETGYRVGAFPIYEYWRDIGRHSEMDIARREIAEKRKTNDSGSAGESR
jgi:dTDP-glucose pyrophosphorylase